MKEINRERFEAWLFSQPKEQEFKFQSTTDCAICAFLKTQVAFGISSGGYYSRIWETEEPYVGKNQDFDWPQWLLEMNLPHMRPLTIANMQARYLELFPDALKLSEVKTETVNHEQNS